MSEREELARLVRQTREIVEWHKRSGTRMVTHHVVPRLSAKEQSVVKVVPVPAAAAQPIAVIGDKHESLPAIRTDLGDCQRCKLCQGRKNIVFGVGNSEARLVFVGEAPGQDEDIKGEPFVGAAGQLLTKMIGAMGLGREDVYICNVIKCRPPGNRNPEPDEIQACEPFLKRQLATISPEIIVCLGKFAAQCLLRSEAPISRLRGKFHTYEGIPLMPTYHPAYLLRNPSAKRDVWGDLQIVMQKLGLGPGSSS